MISIKLPSVRRVATAAFAVVFACGAFAVSANQARASEQGHGGGRSGGGINPGVAIGIIAIGAAAAAAAAERRRQQEQKPQRPTRTTRKCSAPWVYSSRSRKCVCPSSRGYTLSRGKCVRKTRVVTCKWPMVKKGSKCGCAKGYVWSKGRCKKPTTIVKVPPVDIVRVQDCLLKAGYNPGSPDGRVGRKSRDAYRQFQRQHGIRGGSSNLNDPATNARLFEICVQIQPPPVQVVNPPPVVPPVTPVAVTPPPPPPGPQSPVPPQQVADTTGCVPSDIYDLIVANYGARPGLRPCPNACLAKPASFSENDLRTVGRQFGINWCSNCIELGSFVPLADILKIEKLANVTLCSRPPAQLCHLPSKTIIKTYTKVRTIFRRLPQSVGNEGDIAVIIGNEDYGTEIPANVNAQRDAGAVRTLLTEQLGFRDKNIIDLRNASLADIERVFGTEQSHEGELSKLVSQRSRGDIFIYVSSHGLNEEASGQSYLLPVDAKADQLALNGYPLQRLYKNVGKLGARTIMLVLESNFARGLNDLAEPPNLPQNTVNVMPDAPIPGLAVFKASDRDQMTLEDPEFGIGLFTRYFIEGFGGKADETPIGNDDRRIDAVELFAYTSNMVRMAARKSFGLEQKPLLSKVDNLLVGRLAQR